LQKMVGAPATGVYDSDTNVKVKAFQKALGFGKGGQDGLFGPGTMRKLKASQKSPKELADEAVNFVADFVDQFKTGKQHGSDIKNIVKAAGVNTRVPNTQAGKTQVSVTREGFLSPGQETQSEGANMEEGNGSASDMAPNHYCVHHGGVQHEGKIVAAEAVNHNYNDELGKVTHYDMKLEDGTILENVASEDIQVTNASLAEEHSHKRGDGKSKKKKKKGKYDDGDGKDEKCDHVPCNESVIQTPEQENALYEQRFTPKNNRLFEKLLKEWTK